MLPHTVLNINIYISIQDNFLIYIDKINHDDFGKIYSLAAGTALTIGIQKNQFGIELGD